MLKLCNVFNVNEKNYVLEDYVLEILFLCIKYLNNTELKSTIQFFNQPLKNSWLSNKVII